MQPYHCADVARNFSPTLCRRQVLLGPLAVKPNDEISPHQVDLWSLLGKFATEELWQALDLNFMDLREGEPACAAGQNQGPRLIVFEKTFLFGLVSLVSRVGLIRNRLVLLEIIHLRHLDVWPLVPDSGATHLWIGFSLRGASQLIDPIDPFLGVKL